MSGSLAFNHFLLCFNIYEAFNGGWCLLQTGNLTQKKTCTMHREEQFDTSMSYVNLNFKKSYTLGFFGRNLLVPLVLIESSRKVHHFSQQFTYGYEIDTRISISLTLSRISIILARASDRNFTTKTADGKEHHFHYKQNQMRTRIPETTHMQHMRVHMILTVKVYVYMVKPRIITLHRTSITFFKSYIQK